MNSLDRLDEPLASLPQMLREPGDRLAPFFRCRPRPARSLGDCFERYKNVIGRVTARREPQNRRVEIIIH